MGQITDIQVKLDKSLATLAADGVITRLFKELDRLNAAEEHGIEWFSEMLNVLYFAKDIEIGFGHAKAYSLAVLKEHWDEVDINVRKLYGYTFIDFARNITGKESSTIDNYVRTAKVWFIDKVGEGRRVEILERDEEGKPILDEKGKTLTKIVEFNPYLIDLSKLLLVNSRAVKGDMTPKLWEMLVDPFYTCEDIRLENLAGSTEPDFYKPSYFLLGPSLCAEIAGEVYLIAEFNWEEYETNPDIKDAIDHVLYILRVRMEEDKIHDMIHFSRKSGL